MNFRNLKRFKLYKLCYFLKIEDLRVFFKKSLVHHSYLTPFSFQSIFFQFHHCLRNKKQLGLIRIKSPKKNKIRGPK